MSHSGISLLVATSSSDVPGGMRSPLPLVSAEFDLAVDMSHATTSTIITPAIAPRCLFAASVRGRAPLLVGCFRLDRLLPFINMAL